MESMRKKFFSLLFRYKWSFLTAMILFAGIIISLSLMNGKFYQLGSNILSGEIEGETIYNLIFPILYPLNSFVFPFRSLMLYLWESCPKWLYLLRNIYFILPVALSISVAVYAGAARRYMAAVLTFVFSLLIFTNKFAFDLEQIIISSSVLMTLGSFYALKKYPRLRILAVSASLCICMHSKGICFPFCLMVFAFLFYKTFRERKNIILLLICFTIFLSAGIVWSVSASRYDNGTVLFTESGGRLIPNLTTGALGFVQTTNGDVGKAFDSKDKTLTHTAMQSAKIIAANPATYLKSIVVRIIWLSRKISFFAFIFILFVCSCLSMKTVRKMPLLFISAAYFFFIYIIMSVERRYFIPAMFLMSVCSGVYLSGSAQALRLRAKILDYFRQRYNIDKKRHDSVEIYLSKYFPACFISAAAFFHFFVWTVSIILLCTFTQRHLSFDADKYLGRHSGNDFLLRFPLRKGFPHVRDFEGMLAIYNKNTRKHLWNEHWLNYLMCRDKENIVQDSDKKLLAWQDMLLDSFKAMEKPGDEEKQVYDVQTAVLSCMLARGYVRQDKGVEHTGRTREISDRLAISASEKCAEQYEKYVFALPQTHKGLKHKLLSSGAYDMMFPDKVRDMFNERNSERCSSCCVSHEEERPPLKCGIQAERLDYAIEVSPFPWYSDSSASPIWSLGTMLNTMYGKINRSKNKEEKEKNIDIAIKMFDSYLSLFDDEIIQKLKKSPEMLRLAHFKFRPDAAYNLAKLYYLKGNAEQSLKYLVDSFQYREGLDFHQEFYDPFKIIDDDGLYAKIKAAKDKAERDSIINNAINFLVAYLSYINDELRQLGQQSADEKISYFLKTRPEIAYRISNLCRIRKDNANARKFLMETLKYGDGIQVRKGLQKDKIMMEYVSLR